MPSVKKSTTATKTEEVAAPAPAPAPVEKKSSSTKVDKPVEKKAPSTKSDKAPSKKEDKPVEKKSTSKKEDKPVEKKSSSTKSDKAPSKKEDKPEEAKEAKEPKTPRKPPTKDSLNEDFTALETKINDIIEEVRASGQKNAGIANWKSVLKAVKQLHSDSNRVTKVRKNNKSGNTTGGFHKPVAITPELSKFCSSHAAEVAKVCKTLVDNGSMKAEKFTEWKAADWSASEQSTRSKVTKFLCDYVKAKNLQKEDNKREFKVDNDMKALFKLNSHEKDNDGSPIDYCRLQKLVKQHYIAVAK